MVALQSKMICDYYETKGKGPHGVCRYFTGDKQDKTQLSRCRRYCSIMECKDVMGARHYKRHKGAIKEVK